MAGIGFELKKLFNKKGVFNTAKAFGYATVVTSGPVLLGILLLLGLMFLCSLADVLKDTRELLICMITYTLLASLTTTSVLSMVVTRFTADMLYEEQKESVLPSFWGSTVVMMVAGSLFYGIFLLISGATPLQQFLCFVFFNELIITWNGLSYLTAIKDYRGVFLSFLSAIATAFIVGFLLLVLFRLPAIESLLFSVTVGYGVMVVWDVWRLALWTPWLPWIILRSAFLFVMNTVCSNKKSLTESSLNYLMPG